MSKQKLMALFALMLPLITQGDEFPKPINSEKDKNATPLSAREAAARFRVPKGFHVDVFASEPEVRNPIAMDWDAKGRLWIAENYTYAERTQRFDLSLRDRVLIFEDTNGDGQADKRTVFTDQVQMLTSIAVGHGGVWLMCPSRLLFIPDANRDDIPDGPAKVMLDGFKVAKENYHNFANGLKWGPDGWLYGRCGGSCPGRIGKPGTPDDQRVALEGGIWRVHPRTLRFEVLCHGTTNPWGHDWNEFGEGFFINTVNGHLWHMIPGAHYHRPFTLDPNPHVYELIDMHADHWHFDTGKGWTNSREGAANSYGGGHAHSGMMIYLADNWPQEYRGRLFTWNLHGRRANQEILKRKGSGYVASHGKDMLLSADTFCRGLDLGYGPDGAVYVIDWSDTGECHENSGVHRTSGRIYRVSFGKKNAARVKDLRSLSEEKLCELMKSDNEWFVRQARLILAERKSSKAIKPLQQMVSQSNPVLAYRALVTLHAMGATDSNYLLKLFDHENEHLRAWAIRLLTDHCPLDDIFGLHPHAQERSEKWLSRLSQIAEHDTSALVRLALASTLQRLPVKSRATLAASLMKRHEDANDHNLPLLVWYGLMPVAKADPMALAQLAIHSRWPRTQRLLARRVAELMEKHSQAFDKLIVHIAKCSVAERLNWLTGISEGLKGWRRASKPKHWPQVVKVTDKESKVAPIVRDLSVLFGDGRALDEVRRIVLNDKAEMGARRSALQTLINADDKDLLRICLPLLKDARLNVLAAKGLAKSNSVKVADALIQHYRRFRAPQRPKVIEILVSRPLFAEKLLHAIRLKRIPVTDLTAFDVRQIHSLNRPPLTKQVSTLWGEIRESPKEKLNRILTLKKQLTPSNLAKADLSQGRFLFNQSCIKCHRLFGQGEAIGPDLTGANRNNLDYLLENIVDPSAVVNKDFRMTVVNLDDGRTFNGLVIAKNDKTLTLQTQTDRKTINLDEVEELTKTAQSPMPDGLLDNLTNEQTRNLIAYLMCSAQVKLPE